MKNGIVLEATHCDKTVAKNALFTNLPPLQLCPGRVTLLLCHSGQRQTILLIEGCNLPDTS